MLIVVSVIDGLTGTSNREIRKSSSKGLCYQG